jgi:hypothetical protein
MPDVAPQCIGSTPPPEAPADTWEDAPAFRELFLIYFPPEASDAFRQAGARLYEAALEVGLDQVEPDHYVQGHARALAGDLRFVAEVLASLAGAREDAHLSEGEHRLATACSVWSGEVAAIALNIEGAVEREAEP